MEYLLEELAEAVEQYNKKHAEPLDLYEVWDSLNHLSEEEIKQIIKELQ